MIYPPQEDSYLIEKHIEKYAKKSNNTLDMGSGSGILALKAAKYSKNVTAVDINPNVIKHLKLIIKENNIQNIKIIKSDLFKNIKDKFNLIIFNPPYLPLDKNEPEESKLTTTGGKKGHETIERFIETINDHLEINGRILLLFSSLSTLDKVNEIISNNSFEYKEIATKTFFFEKLYIYEIFRSKFLKELNKLELTDIKQFTNGHRGIILTANKEKNKSKVAIKKQREDISATNTVRREIQFLKRLNKQDIGPNLIYSKDDYFVYDFIKGVIIEKYIENHSKSKIKNILKQIFKQCYILDKLGINKEEMHNPYKHIIIDKCNKAHMIDFERTNFTEKPKNITQFVQYICHLHEKLTNKKFNLNIEKLRILAKVYKNNINDTNYNNILDEIK